MRRVCALAVLLSLLPASGWAWAKESKASRREKAFQERVDKAIHRGAAWVDGSFRGTWSEKALVLLTLAHCGQGLKDRSFRARFEEVTREAEKTLRGIGSSSQATYGLGIVAMLIHAVYAGPYGRPPQTCRVAPTPSNPAGLPPRYRALAMTMGRWFRRSRIPKGLWGYGNMGAGAARGHLGYGGDLSNSQYALLGLWATAKLGARPNADFLRDLGETVLRCQEARGPKVRRSEDPDPDPAAGRGRRYAGPMDQARGFGYSVSSRRPYPSMGGTGSMTAGGLSSLLIVKALLLTRGDLRKDSDLITRLDAGVWDAVAWLQRYYSVAQNPVSARGGIQSGRRHAYYLYGLERAMVIAGKRYLGDHDWYREGAEILLDSQAKDGSWSRGTQNKGRGGAEGFQDTCFALLFLKRASLRSKRPLLRTEVTPSEKDVPSSPGR